MLPLHHGLRCGRRVRFQPVGRLHSFSPFTNQSPEVESNHRRRRIRTTCCRYTIGRIYQSVSVEVVGLEPTIPCSLGTWACRCPTPRRKSDLSDSYRKFSGGLVASTPCGSRTRIAGMKDQHPEPLEERGHQSGSGGARIPVCGFSGRRYAVSATDPQQKKPDVRRHQAGKSS
jgi:hypothetical protein